VANKITTTLDLDGNGFRSSLKNVAADIKGAEGGLSKLKAAGAGVGTMLKENMVAAAAAAAAAVVVFAAKGLKAFEDTATAARNMSTATGLSVEASSRWIGVADDMAVSAEALQIGLGRVIKSMDANKFAQYGIATRDAAGEARNANDILLDVFDTLDKTKNATERARLGYELFGKGYAQIAPLVGHTRAEYEKWLATVEDGQVITADELAKSEAMRKAQDELRDAMKELGLAVGEAVTALAPLLVTMAHTITASMHFAGVVSDDLVGAVDKLNSVLPFTSGIVGKLGSDLHKTTDSANDASSGMALFSDAANDAKDATKKADDATRAYTERLDALYGRLNEGDAWQTYKENLYNFKADTDHTEQSVRDHERAILDLVGALKNVPPETSAKIVAAVDAGQYVLAEQMLTDLSRNRTSTIYSNVRTIGSGGDFAPLVKGARASGGPISAGSWLVGEAGPEVVTVGGSGVVTPNGALGGSQLVVNVYGSDPAAVIGAIRSWERRNGKGWRL
jgi:hypothetical protein